MKLLNLQLKAIGPFSGVTLDFSQGNHGLHLIVGPNEAGKSSSLRALSYLFFGFPHSVADDFLHKYDQLRVGATLVRADGESLQIVRRKAAKNDLRADDDATIVKPEILADFLGKIDRESFHHRFGIDHARLRMAGEEIRAGKGHLGELLFAAGTGLAGLRQAQQTLQNRSSELYKPRGQNQRINAALSGLRETQAAQKEYQLSAEEWETRKNALRAAEGRAEELTEQLGRCRKEQSRLDRLKLAIPEVTRRRRLAAERKLHGDAPLLRDAFGQELRAALDSQRLADRTIEHAEQAIAELTAQLEQVRPLPEVIAAAEEIEALQQRLGAVEKAARDRVERDQLRKDKEYRAKQILQDLGRPMDLEQAEAVRLRDDEAKVIRILAQRRAEPLGQLELTRDAIARHQETIADSESALSDLPQPLDVSGVKKAVRLAQKAGDLDSQFEKAKTALTKAARKLDRAISQLSGWNGTAEELQRLPVPSKEALDRFEAGFQAVERRRGRASEAREKALDAIRGLEAQVRTIENTADVPLEHDLDAARERRDLGWRLVRDTWLSNDVDPRRLTSFLGEETNADSLAEVFEASIDQADEIADRLRRESANVARKAGWLSDIRKHAEEREQLENELTRIDEDQARLDSDWAAAIGFLGNAKGRSVAEVRAWLRDRQDAIDLAEKVDEARETLESIESARSRSIETLRLALGEAERISPEPPEGLSDWLERAEALIHQADDLAKRREQLETAIKTANSERASAKRAFDAAQLQLDQWRTEWGPKMERIGLEPDAEPHQAEDRLLKLDELRQVLHEFSGYVSRIKGIDRDEMEFREAVDALTSRVGMPELSGSACDRARALSRLLKEHRAIEVKRENLLARREQERNKLAGAQEERDTSAAVLSRLCREAGCDDSEQLVAVEERSRSRARVEGELRSCEERLEVLAAGVDLDAFSAEVESLDPDELSALLGRSIDDAKTLENEINEVNRTIGEERGAMARMNGLDVRAVQEAENAQAYLAQLQGDVARFAALRLSTAVLRRAVDRFREKSQGPVLARASRLFADLTGGSFTGLQVDEDDEGRMILKGIRPDGGQLGVEGMSEGAHDQLYLALRLASLETWLDRHEPIPFIVDDILMSFDDHRAAAALRALAELSTRTQVLFFTHHEHLADLARDELSADELFVQHLPGRA